MKNIKKIKKSDFFKSLTTKDSAYIDFLKTKIAKHINKKLSKEMISFALTKEKSLEIYEKIKTDVFYEKSPVCNPIIHLVISQVGGGKSSIVNKLKEENQNSILINADNFKRYNPFKDLILKNSPLYFGFLTGLDSYIHQNLIYNFAVKKKYNIIMEIAPSTKENLFDIDLNFLKQNGFKIEAHFLATCKANSFISIHERYENQLKNNKIAKLTDLKRTIDSNNAIDKTLLYLNQFDFINIKLYKREYKNNISTGKAILIKSDMQNNIKVFQNLVLMDFKHTLINKEDRIIKIKEDMIARKASRQEIKQFKKTLKLIKQ